MRHRHLPNSLLIVILMNFFADFSPFSLFIALLCLFSNWPFEAARESVVSGKRMYSSR